jgi:hypothetical protein
VFTRLVYITVAVLLMAGCSVLPIGMSDPGLASQHNQSAASAEAALQELEEIDSLIRLSNRQLASHIETTLHAQAASTGRYGFRRLKLDFARQMVALNGVVDINDSEGNVISAIVSGDILLDFGGGRLEWFPRFKQLKISSRNFTFEGATYIEPGPELARSTLQNFKSDIIDAMAERGDNTITLNAVPLGEVQVGASLPGFSDSPARHTQALRGIFMVTGSAMLIDSSTTSIALDMTFIPELSTCPADVTVSRAEFAKSIDSREPVGIIRNHGSTTDVRYFFSEISGAKRPLTVIHYWFEDGLPMTTKELAVGPSARWRTWSSSDLANTDAKRWEVLVVEKETGCILHSAAIRNTRPTPTITPVDPGTARRTFEAFRDEFNARTIDFSITEDKPVIVQIEVRRPFFRDVLQASLSDLSLDADFDPTALSAMQYTAMLQPFETGDIICDHSACPPAPVCKANLAQCKRLRDTRDCSSCQFRNPLNNRCVSEAIDPLCEASRSRQNARYEADRAACISDAETLKQECNQLAAQTLRSCQIEAEFQDSTCETIKTSIKGLKAGAPLAHVSTRTRTRGKLSANFSNFRIEGNLERLKLDMTLKSDLELDGNLNFSPGKIARPLADCITAWSAPFKSRFATTPMVNNLLSNLEESTSTLTANWSGFGLSIDTNPSPLESVFVGNPQLLANCKIGLTANKVEQAFSGDDSEFFSGHVELEIQPLPTRIHLAPATLELGGQMYSAEAKLSAGHLRYDIEK